MGKSDQSSIRANLADEVLGAALDEALTFIDEPPPPQPRNLISSNKTTKTELPAGKLSLPVRFKDSYTLNRVFFRSYSAAGTVSVLGSNKSLAPDSKEWKPLVPPTEFGPKSFLDQDFSDIEAQFIIFKFVITTPGIISPLGAMGNEFIDQASAEPPTAEELDGLSEAEKSAMVPYDFASLLNGSSISLVSSGSVDGANSMIDDDITSYYEFESDDLEATLFMNLRASYRVSRVSLSVDTGPGLLEVFGFTVPPASLQQADGGEAVADADFDSATIYLTQEFFENTLPLAKVDINGDTDNIELEFEDTDVRYVLFRWLPTPPDQSGINSASGVGNNPNTAGIGIAGIKPLQVYEISLIGMIPESFKPVTFTNRVQFLSAGAPGSGGSSNLNPTPQPYVPPSPPPQVIPDPQSN